jgi:hypothetical protein
VKESLTERVLRAVFRHRDIVTNGDLYLRRFYVSPRIRGWQFMLHKIARPDLDRNPHDHPFDFATLCLRGGYVEHVDLPDGEEQQAHVAGQLRLRAAEHRHRIDRILGPAAWTLVLAGPKRRTWGFWIGRAFTPWRTYLSIPADHRPTEHARRVSPFSRQRLADTERPS